jgi:hypothetical protein
VATNEYMVRAPQPVIHVFCIDVSQPAIASGATAATCQCIEQVLDSLQGAQGHVVLVAVWCWLLCARKQRKLLCISTCLSFAHDNFMHIVPLYAAFVCCL